MRTKRIKPNSFWEWQQYKTYSRQIGKYLLHKIRNNVLMKHETSIVKLKKIVAYAFLELLIFSSIK